MFGLRATDLENDGREVTIFSEREQILDVERLDLVLSVLGEHRIGDDDGFVFEGADTIHRETYVGKGGPDQFEEHNVDGTGGQRTIQASR